MIYYTLSVYDILYTLSLRYIIQAKPIIYITFIRDFIQALLCCVYLPGCAVLIFSSNIFIKNIYLCNQHWLPLPLYKLHIEFRVSEVLFFLLKTMVSILSMKHFN